MNASMQEGVRIEISAVYRALSRMEPRWTHVSQFAGYGRFLVHFRALKANGQRAIVTVSILTLASVEKRPSIFLRADAIRPGDVLLTGHRWDFRKGFPAIAIQLRTLSRWSHAAIFMTKTSVLQATSPGSPAVLECYPIYHSKKHGYLLGLPERDALVLRPNTESLATFAEQQGLPFEQAVPKLIFSYLGRDYAPKHTFAEFAPKRLRPLLKSWLERYSEQHPAGCLIRGWHCSELVSNVYKDAGLPLSDAASALITPRALSEHAQLDVVAKAVLRSRCVAASLFKEPPCSAFSGGMSNAAVMDRVQLALQAYKAGSHAKTVSWLDQSLIQLIAHSTQDYTDLIRHEKAMTKCGALPR